MRVSYRGVMILLGLLTALLAIALESPAQSHEGFIYGKVYTEGSTYIGPIRWGNEEALWTDLFNVAKTTNNYEKLVPEQKKDDNDSWSLYNWNFSSIWENSTIHQFVCQFGDLRELSVSARGEVKVRLKNGGEIMVSGRGYNDIGSKIQVVDPDLGVVNVDWDNITKIEFLPTPAKLSSTFGMPLYGTVEGGRHEKYTGFIVWDNDERLTSDKLDGDSEEGDVAIRFGDIASIEKRSRGSQVALKNGRELYLTGSNDVNHENRGVIVVTPDVGVIKFSWDAFRKVSFLTPDNTGPSYNQYAAPKVIIGTVALLDGSDIAGRIIYDIDEAMDFEMLEGKENGIEYIIPFRNIKRITPKNYDYSLIELTSGRTLLLGDGRDISAKNSGLLVFQKGKKDPVYISWKRINQIIFD